MPTYDYRCQGCGHELEVFHSIAEPARRKCPACGKQKLERLIGSGAGILFKGSGFYQTDYRSDAYKKAAGADKSDSKPTESSAPSTSSNESSPQAKESSTRSTDDSSKPSASTSSSSDSTSKSEAKKSDPAKPARDSKRKKSD